MPRASSPARQVEGFIAKFDPDIGKLTRAGRTRLRRRFPTAVELVYDNYNALAIGYGPNERASEVVVSLAVFARGVNLYFIRGASLPDPHGVLQGSGTRGRFIRFGRPGLLDEPTVDALLRAAVRCGKTPFPATGKGYTVIKSISVKQRPRRMGMPARRKSREVP